MINMVALLALTALSVGCSTPPDSGAPTATARCEAPETPDLQGGDHLIGDREPPVPYSSTPPTSGWHSSGAFEIAVQAPDDPLSEPTQVSVLEAGGVVVTFNRLSESDRSELGQHVSQRYDGRVAVTPYEKLNRNDVAFTGWGVVQRCDALDLEALDTFVAAYADEQPATPGEQ